MNIKSTNTILYCSKWQETVNFYKIKLALEVNESFDWFVEFKLNENSFLSIADQSRASINSCDGTGVTITMKVDNIEEVHAYLVAQELNPTPIIDHKWGARVIHVLDPEGHRLEYWSPGTK
ncbi:hypothetical protein BGP75_20530 [Motiliproteus sp. MSK22-1]|nr:hypothetical protein BGP75_20530 [Motiliproteus sp. MSK22-1]